MRKEVESLERRILKWLFAPGAGVVTVTLFLFSSMVICRLPMTDDEKVGAIWGMILALAVLHFFVTRCEVLRFLLDGLLLVPLLIVVYVLAAAIFIEACHALTGVATNSNWIRLLARIFSASYMWAGVRLVRTHGGMDTSALKTAWLSWLITPPLAERLLDRWGKMLLKELMAKREINISRRGNS